MCFTDFFKVYKGFNRFRSLTSYIEVVNSKFQYFLEFLDYYLILNRQSQINHHRLFIAIGISIFDIMFRSYFNGFFI